METFRQDLALAFRQIRRSKGVMAITVLVMALAIGANTTVFSLLNATFRESLFTNPDRLVMVQMTPPGGIGSQQGISVPEYVALEEQNTVFEEVGATITLARNLGASRDGEPPDRVGAQQLKATLLPLLGIRPLLGRGFAPGEDRTGDPAPVALISHDLWQTRFAGDPGVVDSTILVDGNPTTIIGVMPPGFSFFDDGEEPAAIWTPLAFRPAQLQGSIRFLTVVGRLRSGVSIEQAQEEMRQISRTLAASDPARNDGWEIRLEPIDRAYFGRTRQLLFVLQGAVLFILLIACANVAGVFLVRAFTREREVATRWALGASRLRLLRQFGTESLVLALAGSGLGLALTWIALRIFPSVRPTWLAQADSVQIDARVVAFTLLIAIVSALAFGLIPAITVSGRRVAAALVEFGRGATATGSRRRLQRALVVAQLALTLVLLVAAGLVGKSVARLYDAELGADPDDVLSFETLFAQAQHAKVLGNVDGFTRVDVSPVPSQVFSRVHQRLGELPGVISAAGINRRPLGGSALTVTFTVEGRDEPAIGSAREALSAHYHLVTPKFFETMRIPMLRGRDFTDHDSADAPWVAVINETMARRFFPGRDPLGERVRLNVVPDEQPREIIGVVADTPLGWLAEEREPMLYVPHVQQPLHYRIPYVGDRMQMTFLLRTRETPQTMVPLVRRAVAEVDPNAPVAQFQPIERYLGRQIETHRAYLIAIGLLAAIGMLLAVFGVYGVVAYAAAQRAREVAIRIALGARTRAVVRLFLTDALVLTVIALAVGIGVALMVTQFLASLLWTVTPTDPVIFGGVAALLLVVSLVAAAIPTYAAARLDPRPILAET